MSLRDFNSPSDDPIALHNSPQGNGGGLGNFHTTNPEDREPNNTPKIVGAVAVALMVGVAGVGLFAYSGSSSNKPMVTANTTPAPVVPPAPQSAPDATPAADTSAPAPAASPAPIAPVKSASTSRRIRTASAPVQAAPRQQAAAVPEPVSRTPSPNDVAAANPQPAGAAATASDVPATTTAQNTTAPQQLQSSTPQASNAAPAQDQQPGATPAPAAPGQPAASPAPAQSAGQVAQ
jgi:hypothetical protein